MVIANFDMKFYSYLTLRHNIFTIPNKINEAHNICTFTLYKNLVLYFTLYKIVRKPQHT